MKNDEQAADLIAQFCRNQVNVKRNLPIRSSDMGVLIYLMHHSMAKAKDVAEFFDVAGATVAEMIHRLANQGLVEIQQDLADARVKRIELSASGMKFVEETRNDYLSSIRSMKQTLGEEDFERFISFIQRINEKRVKP